LAWGVQFEIARLVSKGLIVPRDITAEKLEQLRGSNNDAAARVTQVFVNTALGSTGLEQAFAKEMAASVGLAVISAILNHKFTVALGRT